MSASDQQQKPFRLVSRNSLPLKMSPTLLPSSSTPQANSPAWPPRSLGDKLQLLALTKPHAMRVLEHVVDRLLES